MLQFQAFPTADMDRICPAFFASTLSDDYRNTPRVVFIRPFANDEDVTDFVPGDAQVDWCVFARVTDGAGQLRLI